MENGMQPYDDELLVEGMYKAWEGLPTNSTASQKNTHQKLVYGVGTNVSAYLELNKKRKVLNNVG